MYYALFCNIVLFILTCVQIPPQSGYRTIHYFRILSCATPFSPTPVPTPTPSSWQPLISMYPLIYRCGFVLWAVPGKWKQYVTFEIVFFHSVSIIFLRFTYVVASSVLHSVLLLSSISLCGWYVLQFVYPLISLQ